MPTRANDGRLAIRSTREECCLSMGKSHLVKSKWLRIDTSFSQRKFSSKSCNLRHPVANAPFPAAGCPGKGLFPRSQTAEPYREGYDNATIERQSAHFDGTFHDTNPRSASRQQKAPCSGALHFIHYSSQRQSGRITRTQKSTPQTAILTTIDQVCGANSMYV